MIHHFAASNTKTNSPASDLFWTTAYRSYFGSSLSGTVFVDDKDQQKTGVDRLIVLTTGRVIPVEEKLRYRDDRDILLEYQHSDGLPGWIVKPISAEYLAYGWEPLRQVYILPTLLLQRAWAKYQDDWHGKAGTREDGYQYIHSNNYSPTTGRYYRSSSIAVPLPHLLAAITSVISLTF